jgi:hypothetical protein
MATEYKETEVPDGDTRNEVLEMFAQGHPWVFVFCEIDGGGGLNLKCETGGGIGDAATVRSLLQKTIDALPA